MEARDDIFGAFPAPLSFSQRRNLTKHRERVQHNARRVFAAFAAVSHTADLAATQRAVAAKRLAELAEGGNTDGADGAASKRPREDESGAGGGEAVPAPAATPAAVVGPARPARRGLGLLKGLLAEVRTDQAKQQDVLRQRADVARVVDTEKFTAELASAEIGLAKAQTDLAAAAEEKSAAAAQLEAIERVVATIDDEELQYTSSFFCVAEGGDAGYDIFFRPAKPTEAMRTMMVARVRDALPRYTAFRDTVDPFLMEVDTLRALAAERYVARTALSSVDDAVASLAPVATRPPRAEAPPMTPAWSASGVLATPAAAVVPSAAPAPANDPALSDLIEAIGGADVGGQPSVGDATPAEDRFDY